MRLGIEDGFQMVVGPGQKVTELIMGKTTRGIRSLKGHSTPRTSVAHKKALYEPTLK
jgi:hypothetical protein